MKIKSLKYLVAATALLAASCGYQLVGTGGQFPAGVDKIAVPIFANETKNTEIARLITNSFIRELLATGRVSVVPVEEAQAELLGTVKRYEVERITFDVDRTDLQNRMVVAIDVALLLKGDEIPVFDEENVVRTEEYRVVGDLALERKEEDRARVEISRELGQQVIALMTEGF